jgi:hypothetical protein
MRGRGLSQRAWCQDGAIKASLASLRNRLPDDGKVKGLWPRYRSPSLSGGEGDEPQQLGARAWSAMPSQDFCRYR